MKVISVDGYNLEYSIRRSNRAKYPRIQLSPVEGITLIIPQRFPEKEIPNVFQQNEKWLLKNLRKLEEKRRKIPDRKYVFGEIFPYLGKEYSLYITRNGNRYISVMLTDNRLDLALPDAVSPEPRLIREVLEKWYRLRARAEIVPRVQRFAEEMGVSYKRIAIKNQRTIWGSCSQKGNLNFNFRLVMAPEPVLEYIIVHELAHLKEPNHSPRFWDIVGRVIPEYSIHRKWIKEHGFELII
jgi:predicted metal-dependent hydrolase